MTNHSDNPGTQSGRQPRAVAICGPYLSGKTSLTESLLLAAGAIARKGNARDRTMVGDSSPEARARQMSLDVSVAGASWMGESFALLDCPGSVEFQHDTACALMAADAALVVCDPDPARVPMLMPLLRLLEERHIPHLVFINKMDAAHARIRDMMAALQAISSRKMVLRQVPIRKSGQDGGEETIDGYVDLISERAYRYQPGQASALIEMPGDVASRENEARRELLESLADYDDKLLEQLLEDTAPERALLYRDLQAEFSAELIVPVLFGSAEHDHGIQRLWKALRHDVPTPDQTTRRRGLPDTAPLVEIFKTQHQPHTGKLSIARIWRGEVSDGQSLGGARIGGMFRLLGSQTAKLARAQAGDIVALGRLEAARTGQRLNGGTAEPDADWPQAPEPVFALAIAPRSRADDVKLSAALHKLAEEDGALGIDHRADTGELVLAGQGEMHLKTVIDRLTGRYNVPVDARPPKVAYRETIRRSTTQHGRHKRQTGGHGQFGDVTIEIRPQPRGAGFEFGEKIVGGAVPRQYIPGVEAGVRDYLRHGPLGFPVVDIAVTLTDGAFHSVDSSEQAFRQAARIAMTEGMARCESVLLEPIMRVTVAVPNDATAKIQRLISGRRGQILGYDARAGWPGWDEVSALMPQAEIADLIVEIRSLSMGVGHYRAQFDHLQELTGKLADRAIGQNGMQAAE